MGMIKTTNGAIQSVGTTTYGTDTPVVHVDNIYYSGSKTKPMKKFNDYQQGSFGANPDAMIGADDYYAGSLLASTNNMIGVHDAYTGQVDVSNSPALVPLAAAIDSAKTSQQTAKANLDSLTKQLSDKNNQLIGAINDKRRQENEHNECCKLCFSCKTRNKEDIQIAQNNINSLNNQIGVLEGKINAQRKVVADTQQSLDKAVAAHAAKIIELEREETKRLEALALQQITDAQETTKQAGIAVQGQQVTAGTDPNVLAAKLEQGKQKSQTTMLIAAAAVVAIIILAKVV